MAIALDIILLLVFVFTIWRSAVKGFIRTVFDMLKFVVSFIAASAFKDTVASFIMSLKLFENAGKAATEKMAQAIIKLGENFDSEGLISAFEQNNPELMSFIEAMGASTDTIRAIVEAEARKGCSDLAYVVAEYIVEPLMEGVAEIIGFIIVFAAVFLALTLIEIVLNAIFKLPVLDKVNRFGGIVVGLLCAVLYCSLLVTISSPIISNPEMVGGTWDKDVGENTFIYSFVEENNIISAFLS